MALALMPSPPPMITTGWDKSNHLLAFAAMAWLGCKVFPQRLAILLPGLLAYGALIEILQSFTPTRSVEWFDLFADCLGILLGSLMIRFLEKKGSSLDITVEGRTTGESKVPSKLCNRRGQF